MKYLWLLSPFSLFWFAFYVLGKMWEAGFQWWSIPAALTILIVWLVSLFMAGEKSGLV